MKPVEFEGHNTVFGANQPQYLPLPAHIDTTDPSSPVLTCWEFTDEEIESLKKTKRLWIQQLTFHQPYHPILPFVQEE